MTSPPGYITVMYSCAPCGLVDAKVLVRARRENEDIVKWVENVAGEAAGQHHMIFSPRCRNTKMDNMKIPIGGKDKDLIGGLP